MESKTEKKKGLTPAQFRVLEAYRAVVARRPEIRPSLEEIAEEAGKAKSVVLNHLKNMRDRMVNDGGHRGWREVEG